jgi:hypothetical protein
MFPKVKWIENPECCLLHKISNKDKSISKIFKGINSHALYLLWPKASRKDLESNFQLYKSTRNKVNLLFTLYNAKEHSVNARLIYYGAFLLAVSRMPGRAAPRYF